MSAIETMNKLFDELRVEHEKDPEGNIYGFVLNRLEQEEAKAVKRSMNWALGRSDRVTGRVKDDIDLRIVSLLRGTPHAKAYGTRQYDESTNRVAGWCHCCATEGEWLMQDHGSDGITIGIVSGDTEKVKRLVEEEIGHFDSHVIWEN